MSRLEGAVREHAASGTPNDIICGPGKATYPPGRGRCQSCVPKFPYFDGASMKPRRPRTTPDDIREKKGRIPSASPTYTYPVRIAEAHKCGTAATYEERWVGAYAWNRVIGWMLII